VHPLQLNTNIPHFEDKNSYLHKPDFTEAIMINEKCRVLIVEDEIIIALDIRRTLVSLGYDALEPVASGELAIEVVTEQMPDIILMDINLKGKLNGVQTAEIIVSISPVPIIFLSAINNLPDFSPSPKLKIAGYLNKPFDEKHLSDIIKQALSV
jgi:two-component system, response regulator PdtaR